MLCKVADLIVDIPEAGDLVPRSREYLWKGNNGADITIRTDLFQPEYWPTLQEDDMIYMESGMQFYSGLLLHDGLMLHSSAVVLDGKAYLFSGPCGMGKSTHTRLWQVTFGEGAVVINDDKPALRFVDEAWYAYGTPWCGKDGINVNRKAPLAGICFLRQAQENKIRRLSTLEATQKILTQTIHKLKRADKMDRLLSCLDSLVRRIPVFELENRPEPEAARLSYETMRRAAEELGL